VMTSASAMIAPCRTIDTTIDDPRRAPVPVFVVIPSNMHSLELERPADALPGAAKGGGHYTPPRAVSTMCQVPRITGGWALLWRPIDVPVSLTRRPLGGGCQKYSHVTRKKMTRCLTPVSRLTYKAHPLCSEVCAPFKILPFFTSCPRTKRTRGTHGCTIARSLELSREVA
jgi:hypothetical protein